MTVLDVASAALLAAGLLFFTAGTIGLLRLPDLHSRLHALTKADNVGLGMVAASLMLQAESLAEIFKLGLIWVFVSAAGAAVCFLIARRAAEDLERERGRPAP